MLEQQLFNYELYTMNYELLIGAWGGEALLELFSREKWKDYLIIQKKTLFLHPNNVYNIIILRQIKPLRASTTPT